MLRLWPDTLRVGLFPGHCWLQGRQKSAQLSVQAAAGAADLLPSLEAMLGDSAKTVRKGSRVKLTVSDSLAAIVALPWQDALQSPAELQNYAQIHFEKQGLSIDSNWVIHTEFRRYREMGLAYAMPRNYLSELEQIVLTKGLRLKSALPISAAAYCGRRLARKNARTLFLLHEASRTSALIYGEQGLLGYDVEAATGSGQDSSKRLLLRILASYDNFGHVVDWSSEPQPRPTQFISDLMPGIGISTLSGSAWS